MEGFKLILKENPDERLSIIVNEYWDIKNGKFVNSPKKMIEKYDTDYYGLQQMIKKHSYCKVILGYCSDCGLEITKEVSSQLAFKGVSKIPEAILCESCRMDRQKKLENEKLEKIETQNRIREEILEEAIDRGKWKELTREELKILLLIVAFKKKGAIIDWVFKGNFYDSAIWTLIKSIEYKGLIWVKRSENNNVLKFHFSQRLEDTLIPGIKVYCY